MSARLSTIALVGALSVVAHAAPNRPLDPDAEVAQRHFSAGATAYSEGAYELALTEFGAAAKLRPSAEIDFDIARTYDRMGKWKEAADSYQRFVDGAPTSQEAPEVKQRIVALRTRIEGERRSLIGEAHAAPVHRPIYKKAWFWGVVGGAVAVGVGLGVGLGLGLPRDPSPTLGTIKGN